MVILALCASRAESGLVVTSYRTVAQTNGYAPTNQSQYFAEQRLENVSPAVAEVFGDWTGPNADGTPNTWDFVGHSRASSVTTITPDSFTVEASAHFDYLLKTTLDFVDPLSVNTFAPGGGASYRGFFESDASLSYSISTVLNQWGRVRLSRVGGPEIFDESNPNTSPREVILAGTIPPGRYQLLTTASFSVPNLPAGVNHNNAIGSFDNLSFSVRVPETGLAAIGIALLAQLVARRRA